MRLIDADALKIPSTSVDMFENCRNCRLLDEEQVREIIDNAPTIDAVEVVHGEWIDAEIPLESGGSMPIQVCNLCKTFYPLAYTGGGHRFCPNCGARMKGADDE